MMENQELSIVTEVGKSIIAALTTRAVEHVFKKKKPEKLQLSVNEVTQFSTHIANHFALMYNWCNKIEFIGLDRPLRTEDKSVDLDLTFNVRKHTDQSAREAIFDSRQLVDDENNYLILGDPGSGKSTMLKRLLKRFFFSSHPDNSDYTYPLLVKFRDIKEHQNIYAFICDVLGIEYEHKEIKYSVKVEYKVPRVDGNGKQIYRMEERAFGKERVMHQVWLFDIISKDEPRTRFEYFIKGEKIGLAVTRMLEENKVLLFMDGLDEVNYIIAKDIEEQVATMASGFVSSKILITCRPDYLERNFSEFNICQICDLNLHQKKEIAKLWLTDSKPFFESLKTKSYFELSGRPLFLGFLLFLYKKRRALPVTSKEVYLRIINLLVEKWDGDRDIQRHPAFEGFDPIKMVDFLSHLSYNLLHVDKVASFTDLDLQNVFIRIKDRFYLDGENVKVVCNEIENHTGLIHKVYYDRYEFSHLYLQEYLCAAYLVSASSNTRKLIACLKNSPASIAMAISLSPESSIMFSDIIFQFFSPENSDVFVADKLYTTKVTKIILRKLLIETPYFDIERYLGVALMLLCKIANCNDEEFVEMLREFIHQNSTVKSSLDAAILDYKYTGLDKSENRFDFAWTGQYRKLDLVSNVAVATSVSLPVSIGINYVGDEVRRFFGL